MRPKLITEARVMTTGSSAHRVRRAENTFTCGTTILVVGFLCRDCLDRYHDSVLKSRNNKQDFSAWSLVNYKLLNAL